MKYGSTRAGMSLCFARRHRPARRAIPTHEMAGRVGHFMGWYHSLRTPKGSVEVEDLRQEPLLLLSVMGLPVAVIVVIAPPLLRGARGGV